MFIEEIEEKERTLGDKFDEFGKKLGKLCFVIWRKKCPVR